MPTIRPVDHTVRHPSTTDTAAYLRTEDLGYPGATDAFNRSARIRPGVAVVTTPAAEVVAVRPWSTDFTVPSVVEDYDAVQRTFDDETAAAASVRAAFDPVGLFGEDVHPIRDVLDPFRRRPMQEQASAAVPGDRGHRR